MMQHPSTLDEKKAKVVKNIKSILASYPDLKSSEEFKDILRKGTLSILKYTYNNLNIIGITKTQAEQIIKNSHQLLKKPSSTSGSPENPEIEMS